MINRSKLKLFSLLLCSALVLCSCTVNEEIPELKEPVGAAPTFRPVERTDMGEAKIIVGNVMGTEYCHFYEKTITIKQIDVVLGQYVEKGEVLAEADTDSLKDDIAGLNADLKLLNEQHATDEKKYEKECARRELEKEQAEYMKNMGAGSDDMVKAIEKEIEAADENHTYSNLMYEFQKRKMNENIADLDKIVKEGVLKAKQSGYVTFIKDLKGGTDAMPYENIITVTDNDDLFISANMDTRSYQYSKYAVKFAFINGKKVPISEYNYTESETAYAKAQNAFPIQRFKTDEEVDFKPGDYVLLEFYQSDKNDVLVVGKDSYMTDDEGTFVYVKCEDGSLEKRYFEAGAMDEHNLEITSGLEEGEMVLYTQEATLPGMTEEYEVKLQKYSAIESIKGVKYVEESTYSYFSPDKGEITDIYVIPSDEIKKGDPIARIAIDSQKGNLVQIENQIKKENSDYDMFVKDYEKKYEKLFKTVYDGKNDSQTQSAQLEEIKKLLKSDSLSDSDKMKLAEQKAMLEGSINDLAYAVKFAQIDIELLELDKDIRKKTHDNTINSLNNKLAKTRKENDGTGYKTVYAEFDGIVQNVIPSEGDKIDTGKKLVETSVNFKDVVRFSAAQYPEATGYEYTLTIKDDTYPAKVIAGNNNSCAQVFTENGKVMSTPPSKTPLQFYVQIDDEEFFKSESQFSTMEILYDRMRLDNVFLIPEGFIFEETSFEGKIYNYVWIKNGDEAYKRYVQLGTGQKLGTKVAPIIISGINDGDILVK